jgi:DNA-binding IclR family transcriptional regulator
MTTNKSVERAMEILEYITSQRRPVTITEVSSKLEIPKSSTHNILYTLVARNFLEIEDENLKTFKIGFKLFETGVSYLENTQMHRIAHPLLKNLLEACGETVFLAREDGGRLLFLDSLETSTPLRTTARLGRADSPMYCSGLGKALLAAYPAEKVRQIVDVDGFRPITENTVRNFTQLKEELDNTRKRGYAVDNREANTDLICVAAPLRDQSGQAMAAISIATPYFKMDDDHIERFGELIVATALAISRKLGYLGEKMY